MAFFLQKNTRLSEGQEAHPFVCIIDCSASNASHSQRTEIVGESRTCERVDDVLVTNPRFTVPSARPLDRATSTIRKRERERVFFIIEMKCRTERPEGGDHLRYHAGRVFHVSNVERGGGVSIVAKIHANRAAIASTRALERLSNTVCSASKGLSPKLDESIEHLDLAELFPRRNAR